jgi:transcription-repair coupling factor (superfamily II helicase)
MLTPTNRTYTNAETGEECKLYTSADESRLHLIGKTEIVRYYATQIDLTIKLNTKRIINLQRGEYYELKEGEQVTHVKYSIGKFRKL